jgi:hypothetical protein
LRREGSRQTRSNGSDPRTAQSRSATSGGGSSRQVLPGLPRAPAVVLAAGAKPRRTRGWRAQGARMACLPRARRPQGAPSLRGDRRAHCQGPGEGRFIGVQPWRRQPAPPYRPGSEGRAASQATSRSMFRPPMIRPRPARVTSSCWRQDLRHRRRRGGGEETAGTGMTDSLVIPPRFCGPGLASPPPRWWRCHRPCRTPRRKENDDRR